MPFQLGLPEVIVVLVIALLFLGPKRLPEAGRSLGHGIREFKAGMSDNNPSAEPASPQAMLNPATAHLLAAHVVHPADLLHAAHPGDSRPGPPDERLTGDGTPPPTDIRRRADAGRAPR